MRLTPPILVSVFFLSLGLQAADANILVAVDKSRQMMTVSKDGQTLYQWPVSTGRRGYDTPNGTFRAFRMEKDHFSKEWDDAPMPNSIFFTKIGHAIHGYLDTKNIGRPASHGCVRLSPEHAKVLYAMVEKDGVLNTTVTLSGQIPASGPAMVKRDAPPADQYNPAAPPMQINPNAQGGYWQGYQQGYQQPYAQPGYNQPRYAQPQYAQPQYAPRYDDRYPQNYAQRRYDQPYQQYDEEDEVPPPPAYRPRGFFQPWR